MQRTSSDLQALKRCQWAVVQAMGTPAALQGLNVTNSLFDRFNDYSIYPVIQVKLSSILNSVSLGSEQRWPRLM